MEYTISSSQITLTISDKGAEMVKMEKDGVNYLWTGDEKYWAQHAPNLFPFEGRLTDGKYTVHGKEYPMHSHGFAASQIFEAEQISGDSIVFTLKDSVELNAIYPFHFVFRVQYTMTENTVNIRYEVENTGDEVMYFGLGGHPGFNVPLDEGLSYEDYRIEFPEPCRPDRVIHTPKVYLAGKTPEYPLEEGRYIPLRHDLFDEDALVLQNMCREVKLYSPAGRRSVTLNYPDLPYLGIWSRSFTDAPYVAIEPWVNLPSRQDIVEEFSCRSDLIHLQPGKNYTNDWSITLE